MRLVKAARRHPAAGAALLAAALAACTRPAPTAPPPMDCRTVLHQPRAPRLVAVAADGTPTRGAACGSATCLAGRDGAFAWRDDTTAHIEVGDRTLDVPLRPGSPIEATHSMGGIALADHGVVVDRGQTFDVVDARDTRSIPRPTLAPGERVAGVLRLDDGLLAEVRRHDDDPARLVALFPLSATPPAPDAVPIPDHARLAGWLVRGERAAIVDVAGTRTELGFALGARGSAVKLGDGWVVADGCRSWAITPGSAPIALPERSFAGHAAAGLYVVETSAPAPAAVSLVVDGTLAPILGGKAGFDLAGRPLPPGAQVERIEAATHEGRILVVERLVLDTCATEDRLILVDVDRRTAKTLAADEKMRMHPTWAKDRFRFVEADVESSVP